MTRRHYPQITQITQIEIDINVLLLMNASVPGLFLLNLCNLRNLRIVSLVEDQNAD